MFPKCPEMQQQGFTPLGDKSTDDSNIPLEDDGHNNSDVDDDFFPPAPENRCARLPPPPPPGDAPNAPEDSDLDDDPLGIKDLTSHHNSPQWRNIDLPSTSRPSRTCELPGSPALQRIPGITSISRTESTCH